MMSICDGKDQVQTSPWENEWKWKTSTIAVRKQSEKRGSSQWASVCYRNCIQCPLSLGKRVEPLFSWAGHGSRCSGVPPNFTRTSIDAR